MEKFIVILFLILMRMSSVHGLLPPFYESRRELVTLLEHPELAEKLPSGQVIELIKRTNKGYEIETPNYQLQVEVVYDPTGRIGPAAFQFLFHDKKEKIE